jgi:hypothetical protein
MAIDLKKEEKTKHETHPPTKRKKNETETNK